MWESSKNTTFSNLFSILVALFFKGTTETGGGGKGIGIWGCSGVCGRFSSFPAGFCRTGVQWVMGSTCGLAVLTHREDDSVHMLKKEHS